jgi:hypothetical protein
VQGAAICDGLRADVDRHTVALIEDGGPMSLATGQRLISRFDAGCKE